MKLNVGRTIICLEPSRWAILINRVRSPSERLIILLTPVNRVVCIHRRAIASWYRRFEQTNETRPSGHFSQKILGRRANADSSVLWKKDECKSKRASLNISTWDELKLVSRGCLKRINKTILWVANQWSNSTDLTQRTLFLTLESISMIEG